MLRREFAHHLIHGSGWWYFDMTGGWFDCPEILAEFKKQATIARQAVDWDMTSAAEVACLVSAAAPAYHPLWRMHDVNNYPRLLELQCDRATREFYRSGVLMDWLMTDDLEKDMDRYKALFFHNSTWLSKKQRKAVEALKSGGRALIFVGYPGLATDDKLDVQAASRLVGMNLKVDDHRANAEITPRTYDDPAMREIKGKLVLGPGAVVGPRLVPDDADATVLACWPDGAPAAAVKRTAGFTSYYFPVSPNHCDLFRTMCRDAGCFVYSTNNDVLFANGDMLKRTDRVLGANRVAWEQSAEAYVNGCIYEAMRQEGTWAPDSVSSPGEEQQIIAKGWPKPPYPESPALAELRKREKDQDERLAKILKTVKIDAAIKKEGPDWPVPSYSGTATITMLAEPPAGCKIHYTLDGTQPTAASPVYEKPVQAVGRLRVRAALFDASGNVVGGYVFGPKYNWKDQEKNLTTGKPVKVSGIAGQGKDAEVGENANDGWVGNGKIWGAWDPPQWWQVDLQGNYNLDRIRLFPYDQGGRVFQYTIEVSTDEKNWARVVDESANTKPEMGQGHEYKFKPAQARYVRVNMLKNSIHQR